eukprot:8776034-Lingulodinium_polyedra.AAC.1
MARAPSALFESAGSPGRHGWSTPKLPLRPTGPAMSGGSSGQGRKGWRGPRRWPRCARWWVGLPRA